MRFIKNDRSYFSVDKITNIYIANTELIKVNLNSTHKNDDVIFIRIPEGTNITIDKVLKNLMQKLLDDSIQVIDVNELYKGKERKSYGMYSDYVDEIIKYFKKGYNITEVSDKLNELYPNLLSSYSLLYGYIKDKPYINRYVVANSKKFGKKVGKGNAE